MDVTLISKENKLWFLKYNPANWDNLIVGKFTGLNLKNCEGNTPWFVKSNFFVKKLYSLINSWQ